MATRTALNTILRDAAKTPLLTGERSAFVPGMTQHASHPKINLDSILLICPSCQCVAAVALDREGKSASLLVPSRPERGALAIATSVGRDAVDADALLTNSA
jgi:hypothetical protein